MAKTSNGTPTYAEVLAKLNAVKAEHESFEKGQRMALYQRLQQVTEVAVMVEADNESKARFCKERGKRDVLRAALDFVFSPKSEAEKKEASKRTQALKYLIKDLRVAAEEVAEAIQEHGGIEKLAALAAKQRQDEGDQDHDQDDDEIGEDQDQREEAAEISKPANNVGKQISVGFSPKLATKLNQYADKTRIKIIGYIRISPDEKPTIEAKRIIKMLPKEKGGKKSRAMNKKAGDDASDWSD